MAEMTMAQAEQIIGESPDGVVVRINEHGVTVSIDRDTEIDDDDLGKLVAAAVLSSESYDERGRANLACFARECGLGYGPVPRIWDHNSRGDRIGRIPFDE